MKYSIVTGACGGLGKEFVKKLISNNENLILIGRDYDRLNNLKNSFDVKDISILVFKCDLSSSEDRNNVFNEMLKHNVEISALYYVAGQDIQKAFVKYSQDGIITQARVCFEGALAFTKFCIDNRCDNLKLLIVSSITGFCPMPYFAEYSAIKGALISFYKSLKVELKGTNTKITVLCPSSMPTRDDIIEDIKKQGLQGKLAKKSPEYVCVKGLKALEKDKTICVPGFYNKIVNFLNSITPFCIKSKIIESKFKNKEKDIFSKSCK